MGKIIDLTGKEQELNGCMGCEVACGNLVPFGGVLYQDEQFVITQDVELPINGFIIISTVRHIEKFTELTDDERMNLTNLINKTLKERSNNNIRIINKILTIIPNFFCLLSSSSRTSSVEVSSFNNSSSTIITLLSIIFTF